MMEILTYDEALFRMVNGAWRHDILDTILPLARNKIVWIPLYVFIASFMLENFKLKGLYWVVFAISLLGVSDFVSSKLIKKNIKRERPCQNEGLKDTLHLRVACGSGYSFTSSHASNHFTIATFIFFTLGAIFRWIKIPVLLWAGMISYAQVYVGVHYPLDVICGALLGIFIATIGAAFYGSLIRLRIVV